MPKYRVGDKVYNIPEARANAFLEKYPNAQLVGDEPEQPKAEPVQPVIPAVPSSAAVEDTTAAKNLLPDLTEPVRQDVDTSGAEPNRITPEILANIRKANPSIGGELAEIQIDPNKDPREELARLAKENSSMEYAAQGVKPDTLGVLPNGEPLLMRNIKAEQQRYHDLYYGGDRGMKERIGREARIKRAQRALDKQEDLVTRREEGRKGFFGEFWDTFTDAGTWDFGLGALNDAYEIKDAADHPDDPLNQLFLQTTYENNQIQAQIDENTGAFGRFGRITAQALPFVGEFLLTGGYSGVAEGVGGAVTRGVAKGVGKSVAKREGLRAGAAAMEKASQNFFVKALGTTAGDLTAATLMANTVGAGKTLADIEQRHLGTLDKDENGDFYFKDQSGWLEAIYKGEASNIIEYYTEMLGEHAQSTLAKAVFDKGVKKGAISGTRRAVIDALDPSLLEEVGVKAVTNNINIAGATGYTKAMSKLFNRAGMQGYPFEVMEEEAGIFLNSVFTGDNSLSDFNVFAKGEAGRKARQQQLDIWGGMLFSIGTMRAMPMAAGYGIDLADRTFNADAHKAREFEGINKRVNLADIETATILGEENWAELKERIDDTPNDGLTELVSEITSEGSGYTQKQQEAITKYVGRLYELRGFNTMSFAQAKQQVADEANGIIDESPVSPDEFDRRTDTAYMGGYHAPEENHNDIKNAYEYQRANAAKILGTDEASVEKMKPSDVLGERVFGMTDEETQAMMDFFTAKSAFDGMIQGNVDDIDTKVAAAANLIDVHTHDSGVLVPATMKDDRKVYVKAGNVMLNDEGTAVDAARSDAEVVIMDEETGKVEMVSPGDILSLDAAIDPTEYKEQVSQQIREAEARQKSDNINGKIQIAPGVLYAIRVEDGKQANVQIVPVIIDEKTGETSLTDADGLLHLAFEDGTPYGSLTAEQLQQQVDEANLARLAEHEMQKAGIRAGEKAAEQESARPQYAINDDLVLRDVEGNIYRGQVTAMMEDDNVEVATDKPIDGKQVSVFPREELDRMLYLHNGQPYEQPEVEKPDQPEPAAPTEEPLQNTKPIDRIPRDIDTQEPLWELASVKDTYDALVDENEGDAAEALDTAQLMMENAQGELAKAQRAAEKKASGKTVSEIQKAKAARKAAIKRAQESVNYWTNVVNHGQDIRRKAEIAATESPSTADAQRKMNLTKAREVVRKEGRFKTRLNKLMPEYLDFEDYVKRTLLREQDENKLKWSNSKDGVQKGLGSHMGLNGGREEMISRGWLLNNEKGKYPEELADELLSAYAEETNQDPHDIDGGNPTFALSVLLDAIRENPTAKSMMDDVDARHGNATQQMDPYTSMSDEDAQMYILNEEAKSNGMTLDDYLAYLDYTEQRAAEYAADADEINAIFAEQYLEEDERRNQPNEVLGGVPEGQGPQAGVPESPQMVQGEQSSDAGDIRSEGPVTGAEAAGTVAGPGGVLASPSAGAERAGLTPELRSQLESFLTDADGQMGLLDAVSPEEANNILSLSAAFQTVNERLGDLSVQLKSQLSSKKKAEREVAERQIQEAQQAAAEAWQPAEDYYKSLLDKYGLMDVDDEQFAAIQAAREQVNTNPTDAQKEAGNYRKGHVTIDGYDISIENPKGSVRKGTDRSGKTWEQEMNNDYGYIRRTEGPDGDHIDVFLSDKPFEGNVFVVDQVDPETGAFDEHKVMYGFNTADEAREAYLANYEEGWKGLGNITEVTKDEFRKWIDSSHRKTKPFAEYKSVRPVEVAKPERETIHINLPSSRKGWANLNELTVKEQEDGTWTADGFLMYGDGGDSIGTSGNSFKTKEEAMRAALERMEAYRQKHPESNYHTKDLDNLIKEVKKMLPATEEKPDTIETIAVQSIPAIYGEIENTRAADKGKPGRKEILEALYQANPQLVQFRNEQDQQNAISDVIDLARQYPDLAISQEILRNVTATEKHAAPQAPAGPKAVNVESLLGAVNEMAQGRRDEVKLSDHIEQEQPEAEPAQEAPSETDAFSIERRFHQKNGTDIYALTFKDRVSREEFVELKKRAKDFGGYWSNFGKKGFIFKTEDDARKFGEAVLDPTGEKLEEARPVSMEEIAQVDEAAVQQTDETSQELGLDASKPVQYKGDGKPHTILMVTKTGEQVASGQFTKGAISTVVLNDLDNPGKMLYAKPEEIAQYVVPEAAPEEVNGYKVGDRVTYTDTAGTSTKTIDHFEKYGDTWFPVFEKEDDGRVQIGVWDNVKRYEEPTAEQPQTELATKPVNPSGNKLVTDEKYEELRKRMLAKLNGQMNMGIDPEILSIGVQMAVYHIEKGARKFVDYAKSMIADLGDAIRPYLKAFYNGARDLPEVEDSGLASEMTPYDEVKTFDLANFDKPSANAMEAAAEVVKEQEVEEQKREAGEKIKKSAKSRNKGKNLLTLSLADGTSLTVDKSDYHTFLTPEAKEFFEKKAAKDEKKLKYPQLAYLVYASDMGVKFPYEALMSIPEIAEAQQKCKDKGGKTLLTDPEKADLIMGDYLEKMTEVILGEGNGSAVFENGRIRKVDGKEDFSGEVAKERKAFLVIGRSAGGKSTVYANPLSNQHKARIIDSDIVKPHLYGWDDGNGADYVHGASSLVAKMAQKIAVERGENIVIPKVGTYEDARPETYFDLIEKTVLPLIKAGYTVEFYLNDISEETSLTRCSARFAATGRYIDMDYLHSIADKPNRVFTEFATKTLGEYGNVRQRREGSGPGAVSESETGHSQTENPVENVGGRIGNAGGTEGRGAGREGVQGVRGLEGLDLNAPLFAKAEWKTNEGELGTDPILVWSSESGEPVPGADQKKEPKPKEKKQSRKKPADEGPTLFDMMDENYNDNEPDTTEQTQEDGQPNGPVGGVPAGGNGVLGTEGPRQSDTAETGGGRAGEQGVAGSEQGTVSGGRSDGGTPSVSDRAGEGQPERPDGRPSDQGGNEASRRRPAGDNSGKSQKKVSKPAKKFTRNFHYGENASEIDNLTPALRLKANIDAIEVLAKLFTEGRAATAEEKETLSKFRGWGGIPFGHYYSTRQLRDSWNSDARRLADALDVLDPDGNKGILSAISKAALTSFYTPAAVARTMNRFLSLAGFKGGSLLDPSMGSGIFEGTLPEDIQQRTMIHGVELDWLTGQIAKALYPDGNIQITGFEDAGTAMDAYDVVESNIPFGSIKVSDPTWKHDSSPVRKAAQGRIHNYFTVKMLEATKPGGLCVIMTSNAILDTDSNAMFREYIADQAEILGVVRLPDNTFKGAGTSAVTDVLFLRKFRDSDDRSSTRDDEKYRTKTLQPFLSSVTKDAKKKTDGEKTKVTYNGYFGTHPDFMIGDVIAGNQYKADAFGLTSSMSTDEIADAMDKILEKKIVGSRKGKLFNTAKTEREVHEAIRESYVGSGDYISSGNIVEQDGKFGVVTLSKNKYGDVERTFEERPGMKGKAARIRAMFPIRTTMKKLVAEQIAGASNESLDGLRKELREAYDKFVNLYGRLQDSENTFLDDDIDGYMLRSLEKWREGEFVGLSDIFTKNTIKPAIDLSQAQDGQSAISVSLAEYGEIRPDFMEEMLGEKWFDLCKAFVFRVPFSEDCYETKDAYLSGDVKTKLEQARKAAEADKQFQRNVEELEAVQPRDIAFDDISVHMGARWIPQEVYSKFMQDIFGIHGNWKGVKSGVIYSDVADSFIVNVVTSELGGKAQDWATNRRSAKDIFEAALSDKTVKVMAKDSDGKEYLDIAETEAANEKVANLREAFEDWLPQDAERVKQVAQLYNDKFNRTVLRKFDGSHLQIPGLMGMELRPHQKDAVWMLINNRGGIVDHMVGAGKTLVMQSAIMEMRRMGIAKKPMIVALKSTVAQITKEFIEAYPSARILAPTEKDFQKANRKKFLSNIALNDYDCIIVSHEQYCMLPHTEEVETQVVREQLAQLDAAIQFLYGQEDQSQLTKRQLKGLEKRKANLEAKLKDLMDRKVDREFTFESLGVDYLFVDECQHFKSLPYVTSYQNVAGLGDAAGSQKAIALLNGVRYLQGLHQGDMGTTFLSGTTITNSLVEIYNLLQYLRPREMESLGFTTFDAWAGTFAQRSGELEYGVTQELKEKNRFRRFDNVPELARLYAEIADVRNDLNLKLPKPKPRMHIVTVPASDMLKEINAEVIKMVRNKNGDYFYRMGAIKKATTDKSPFGLLASGISTKAAISMKLLDPDMEDDGGKIHYVCENVAEIYKKFADQKGTQLIFCDTGVPTKESKYDVYTDIIERLVNDYGIPREEIVDIHVADTDKKRKELFAKVREGSVRVLIGGTKNMGTGVNVQPRLVALHHIDVPWTPADREQREGRGVRQGNIVARDFNDDNVDIYFYAAEESLDLYKYQLQDTKGKMFSQFKQGTIGSTERSFDEGSGGEDGSFDPAEIVALLSGNPVILEKSKQDKKVEKLRRAKRTYESEWHRRKADYDALQAYLHTQESFLRQNQWDIEALERGGFKKGDDGKYPTTVTVEDYNKYGTRKTFDKPKEAGEYIHKLMKEKGASIRLTGFGQTALVQRSEVESVLGGVPSYEWQVSLTSRSGIPYRVTLSDDDTAAGSAFRNVLQKVFTNHDVYQRKIEEAKNKLEGADPGEMSFPKQDELDEAEAKKKELDAQYKALAPKDEKKTRTNDNEKIEEEGANLDEEEGIRTRAAFHGSPADFDTFDNAHMGEGEGHQSHGWGTYVSFDERTATRYSYLGDRDKVTYKGEKAPTYYAGEIVDFIIMEMKKGVSFEESKAGMVKMLKDAEARRKETKDTYWMNTSNQKEIDFVEGLQESDFEFKDTKRNLYTVDIPDDTGDNYINEDTNLTKKQREKLANALRDLPADKWMISEDEALLFHDPTLAKFIEKVEKGPIGGDVFYATLAHGLGSKKAASEFLSDAGFAGILYVGGTDGECAVIFNDKDIKIEEKRRYRTLEEETGSREIAQNLLERFENQNGEDKPWIANGEPFFTIVEDELPYNRETAPLFAMIDQYRRLDDVDFEEGRRDFTGGDMEELFDNFMEALRGYASGESTRYRIRNDAPPQKTGTGYKVFYLKDGLLYPPMVANAGGAATPVGVWLDADAAPVAGYSKEGRPLVNAGGKGTQGGRGKLAYRPGWHLGTIPYALQFNRGKKVDNPLGVMTKKGTPAKVGQFFPKNFVWAEVEYAADVDYQKEANSYGQLKNGKFRHSYAGLPYLPSNGSYSYRTNPNPATDPWIITGAMKVNRVLTPSEVDELVKAAGRAPQQRQAGSVTDEQIRAINETISERSHTDEASKIKAARELGRRLGVNVQTISNVEKISGSNDAEVKRARRSKGWYGTTTRKVTVVIPNNADVADVQATIFHEVVGHRAIKDIVGKERFNNFLNRVWFGADESTRAKIVDAARSNQWDFHEATEEYIAGLAEVGFSERENAGFVEKVVQFFRDMLSEAKLRLGMSLNENDIMYALWRGYQMQKRHGAMAEAENVVMQERLGVGQFAESRRFRSGGPAAPAPTGKSTARATYEEKVRIVNKNGEKTKTANLGRRLLEAYQDSMYALKVFQQAISEETGNPIADNENAYMAENRMSSMNRSQAEIYNRDFYTPLMDAIKALTKAGAAYPDITRYIIAKHGLERNEVFSKREAEKDGGAWDGKIQDFSGLTDLTGEKDDFTAAADEIVRDFEDEYETDQLWDRINAATKETLRKSYDSGLMTRDVYNRVKDMFKFYIPLRGWSENVAEEEYDYLVGSRRFTSPTIKKAEGRKSIADDPIATIGHMAESAIAQGNRNTMKQKLLNFVLNNPTTLASVSEQWYVKDAATGTWEPRNPNIPEDATGDEVADLVDTFEADMKVLEAAGEATRQRAGLTLGKHVTAYEGQEHVVRVMRGGREYCIYVNASPRAAQAVNGLTNPDAVQNAVVEMAKKIKNFMARMFTSQNPSFIISNLSRDVIWAGTAVAVKEDADYNKQYQKNILGSLAKVKLVSLVRKFQQNKLDEGDEVERYFKEFIENGGETGFTNINTVDDFKKDIEKMLREAKGGVTRMPKRVWNSIWDAVEFLNRAAEDTTRFAVYMTSRQQGRTVARSIYDAKEITVNFNKKGSGGYLNNVMKFAYIFFNATIQSLANFGKLLSEHPAKMSAALTTFAVAGFISPFLNAWIQAIAGDGDGDDDWYWDLPEWVRRNNLVFHIPFTDRGYLTIPLPHELRAFFGMGEIANAVMQGKEKPADGLKAAIDGFSTMAPIDYTGNAGSAAVNLTPTVAQPFAQLIANKDFFGKPIYKRNDWNKRDPEWTKAYRGTSSFLVNACQWLNDITGGDEVKSGLINLNPAIIEHLFESYLGGVGKTVNRSAKTVSMLWDEDMRQWRNVPVASTFYQEGDERSNGSQLNREYFDYREEHEDVEHMLSGYKKKIVEKHGKGDVEGEQEYREILQDFVQSPEFKRYQALHPYVEAVSKCNSALKNLEGEDRKRVEDRMNELKKELVEKLHELNEQ